MSLQADIQKEINKLYNDSELIELFTLDATAFGGPLFNFTNNPGPTGGGVVMGGVTYAPMPIMGTGFDTTSTGTLPNPAITISNVNKVIQSAVYTYGDLIGARLTRLRTYGKFLDAATFPRRNLLTHSQDWSNAAWTKTRSTAALVTDPLSPVSKKDAFRITEDTSTNTHFVQGSSCAVVSGQTYTFSVYARKYGARTVTLELGQAAEFTSTRIATFDLDTGAVLSVSASTTASAVDMGNGWFRCKITAAAAASGNTEPRVYSSTGTTLSYTGVAGNGVYLYGAQFEQSTGNTAYQYTSTSHQPFANPAAVIGPEKWRIEQLTEHNASSIQFILSTDLDRMRLRFGRQVLKDQTTRNVYAPGIARTRVR